MKNEHTEAFYAKHGVKNKTERVIWKMTVRKEKMREYYREYHRTHKEKRLAKQREKYRNRTPEEKIIYSLKQRRYRDLKKLKLGKKNLKSRRSSKIIYRKKHSS